MSSSPKWTRSSSSSYRAVLRTMKKHSSYSSSFGRWWATPASLPGQLGKPDYLRHSLSSSSSLSS